MNYRTAFIKIAQDLAKQANDNLLGGSQHPWHDVETFGAAMAIAIIFDRDFEVVDIELSKHAHELYTTYFDNSQTTCHTLGVGRKMGRAHSHKGDKR